MSEPNLCACANCAASPRHSHSTPAQPALTCQAGPASSVTDLICPQRGAGGSAAPRAAAPRPADWTTALAAVAAGLWPGLPEAGLCRLAGTVLGAVQAVAVAELQRTAVSRHPLQHSAVAVTVRRSR